MVNETTSLALDLTVGVPFTEKQDSEAAGLVPRDAAWVSHFHPMAYWEAYAVARSCLAALAHLEGDKSWHYELLLIELDSLHLVFPAHGSLAGNRELLLLIFEMALDRMIALGGDVIALELELLIARTLR